MLKNKLKSMKGFSLVEVMIAVAIIAIVGVAIFSGLTLSTKILMKTDIDDTARSLAVSQMEFVKNTYWNDVSYNNFSTTLPSGYSINTQIISNVVQDGNLQKIKVDVTHDSIPRAYTYTLEDYKIK